MVYRCTALYFLTLDVFNFSSGVVGVSTSSEEELDNDLRQGIQNIM
jgi:hypothetical protein